MNLDHAMQTPLGKKACIHRLNDWWQLNVGWIQTDRIVWCISKWWAGTICMVQEMGRHSINMEKEWALRHFTAISGFDPSINLWFEPIRGHQSRCYLAQPQCGFRKLFGTEKIYHKTWSMW